MKLTFNVSDYLTEEKTISEIFQEKNIPCPELIFDGKIHRFNAHSEKSGWYFFYDTGDQIYGAFGDWALDVKFTYSQNQVLTSEQRFVISQRIKEQEQARIEEQKLKAKESQEEFFKLSPANINQSYILSKKIRGAYGTKIDKYDNLVVPVYDCNTHEIQSLQYISPNGQKRFKTGAKTKDGYYQIGDGTPEFMVEGFATGASVYEATGKSVICAFSANNLVNLGKVFPYVTIVADNDESQTGERKAKESGLKYILIPQVGMDANDYVNAGYNLRELLLQKPNYKLIPGNQILTQPQPHNWLIKNWILQGKSLSMTFGTSGHGKSFVAIDRMLCIATGINWANFPTKQGKVLYLCGEGLYTARERIALWCQVHNIKELNNFIISEDAIAINGVGFAEVVSSLQYIDFHPDLICIDTVNRFFDGNENDAKEVGDFIRACDRLSEIFNCHVNIVHHSGLQEQDRARGSSAFLGALDLQDRVEKQGENITITQTKNKGGKQNPPLNMQLKEEYISGWYDEDGATIQSAYLIPGGTGVVPVVARTSEQDRERVEILTKIFTETGDIQGGKAIITRGDIVRYFLKKKRQEKEKNPDENEADFNRKLKNSVQQTTTRFIENCIAKELLNQTEKGFEYYTQGWEENGVKQPFFQMDLDRKIVKINKTLTSVTG